MAVIEEAVYDFERAVLASDRLAVKRMVAEWRKNIPPVEIVEDIIAHALEHIGTKWEQGSVSLAQVYLVGRACEELVDTLLPPADPARKSQPKMAIAVLQDYHVLGKRIIYSTLRAGGYDLLDLGHGLTVDELVQRCLDEQVHILLISVLMLPSALQVKEVGEKLKARNPSVKIVVGGAPFRLDEQLWKDVGADYVGYNSGDALRIVAQLMEERS